MIPARMKRRTTAGRPLLLGNVEQLEDDGSLHSPVGDYTRSPRFRKAAAVVGRTVAAASCQRL